MSSSPSDSPVVGAAGNAIVMQSFSVNDYEPLMAAASTPPPVASTTIPAVASTGGAGPSLVV